MPTFALRRPHGGGYSAAMLDIHLVREKPDFVRERLATRGGGDERKINEVVRADGERRKLETALQHLNAERRRLSKEIGAKRAASGATADLEARVREIGDEIVDLNKRTSAAEEEQRNLLLEIANLPHGSVPTGRKVERQRFYLLHGRRREAGTCVDQFHDRVARTRAWLHRDQPTILSATRLHDWHFATAEIRG